MRLRVGLGLVCGLPGGAMVVYPDALGVPGVAGSCWNVPGGTQLMLCNSLADDVAYIEAIIDNVVARAFVKKGLKLQVFLGDRATDVAVQKDADGNPTETPMFRGSNWRP